VTQPSSPASSAGDQSALATLRHYREVLGKRRWAVLSIVAVGVTGTVLFTLQRPKVYEANATIIVNPQAPRLTRDDDVIELGAGALAFSHEYYNTQIEVLKSFPLAHATVLEGPGGARFYNRLVPAGEHPELTDDQRADLAAEHLLDKLVVVQHHDTRIIAIKIRSVDRELAKDLTNTHVASYLASVRSRRTVGTGQASQVLSAQLDTAKNQLRDAEAKITMFKAANDLTTLSFEDKQNTVVTELQRYSAALADARVKRIEIGAQYRRAQALAQDDALASPIFGLASNDPSVDQLKLEYARATQEFVGIDAKYGPKSAQNKAAKDKVDALRAQLQNEASRAIREIGERYQATVAAEHGYELLVNGRNEAVGQLDKLYAAYSPLLREQKFAELEYTKLLTHLESSRQEGRNDLINVEPNEMAREAELVLPRMSVNVTVATILSLLLGIGLAFLLAHLDRTVKGAEGLEQLVGAPVLGIIPMITDEPNVDVAASKIARDLYVFKNPKSQVAECCRSIRTNILFSAADRPMKTITVSSPRPGEGKTTTAIYLGTTMAQGGQRVLVIDTDLRRSRLHKSFGVSPAAGLTTLLLGDANYDTVVTSTDVPGLFVLPCGPQPPNPVELLLTKRFGVVLEELAKRFDRILLDSPPVLAVTDAVVLSRLSDGVILVARAAQTLRDDVMMSVRQFRDIEVPILGVILNVTDTSERRYGGYYYAYGGYAEPTKPEAA
jgi:capsular exopolysaccharide synthesis family protein